MTAIPYRERHLVFTRIRQKFQRKGLKNLGDKLNEELKSISPFIQKDCEIAIGVGSRGINNIQLIVAEVVKYVKDHGGKPFIFPAMGSHGGATAEGQVRILRELGITSENTGAPVRASMEVVNLSDDPSRPAYIDKNANSSDGIILVNRITQHTDFSGEFESGLVKMAVIGLGKVPQAEYIHGKGVEGLEKHMPEIARRILASGKIIGGVGIVEDAYKDTMEIQVIPADLIMEREKLLLNMSLENYPRLPFRHIDVLIVDQLGKDISGIGMDPYVIGRLGLPGMPDPEFPKIRSVIACDLTRGSHGNGLGIGLADVITRRLFKELDLDMIYRNNVMRVIMRCFQFNICVLLVFSFFSVK